jgi:hypothetical protein
VHTRAQVTSVRGEGERVVLHTGTASTVSAQQLLVAVGRRPATTDLGLDAAGYVSTNAASWWSTGTWPPAPTACTPRATSTGCSRTPTPPTRWGASRSAPHCTARAARRSARARSRGPCSPTPRSPPSGQPSTRSPTGESGGVSATVRSGSQ